MYIRVNNKIYKVSRKLKNGTYLIKGMWHIDKSNDIKESDTIKELCDLWICIDLENNKHNISLDFNDFEIESESKGYIIYGAILDKENINNPVLKIVAKTDKKGELILI